MLQEIKDKIGDELERLAHELNVTLPEAIEKAVELGDLRENADYKSALERQQFVQARIGHLTQRMGELSKIDVTAIPMDRVGFGSRIRAKELESGDEEVFTMTAGDYIDLDKGQISMASPLGRAFMGHQEGDQVIVRLPRGETHYEILELTTLREMVE